MRLQNLKWKNALVRLTDQGVFLLIRLQKDSSLLLCYPYDLQDSRHVANL